MQLRSFCIVASLLLCPAIASAQFTTFMARAKRVDTTKVVTAHAEAAKVDSASRATLTNMKAWVDSAAGLVDTGRAVAAVDTGTARAPGAVARAAAPVTTFRNGEVAPNTASNLPMLALIGFAAISLGTVMLAGRRHGA